MKPFSALVAVLATASLPAQNVIVVQGGGGALQQAVNAAQPNDILDVMPARTRPRP